MPQWLEKLGAGRASWQEWRSHLSLFSDYVPPPDQIVVDGTPEEMIRRASWRCFWISTLANLPPAPWSFASIVPEFLAVSRLQMELIHRLAKAHGQEGRLSGPLRAYVVGHAFGLKLAGSLARHEGAALMAARIAEPVLGKVYRMLGVKLVRQTLVRSLGRWIPVVVAPLFGELSRRTTLKIGQVANDLFAKEAAAASRKMPPPIPLK